MLKILIVVYRGESWNGKCCYIATFPIPRKTKYGIAIWHILRPFGIFCGHLVYYFLFWYALPTKIWQPRLNPWISHFTPGKVFGFAISDSGFGRQAKEEKNDN
jgi:hypothetical protein